MTEDEIKERQKAFEEACKPLIKYLNDNHNPHALVIVVSSGAQLLSGEMSMQTYEFVKD